jgi:hypothetical protein
MVIGTIGILAGSASLVLLPRLREKTMLLIANLEQKDQLSHDHLLAMISAGDFKHVQMQQLQELVKSDELLRDQIKLTFEYMRKEVEYKSSLLRIKWAAVCAALSFLLLVGAIGIFRLKSWGKGIVLVEATLWTLAQVHFQTLALPQKRELIEAGLQMARAFGHTAHEARLTQMLDISAFGGEAIFWAPSAAGYALWMGFLLWFFSRESVKQQFEARAEL